MALCQEGQYVLSITGDPAATSRIDKQSSSLCAACQNFSQCDTTASSITHFSGFFVPGPRALSSVSLFSFVRCCSKVHNAGGCVIHIDQISIVVFISTRMSASNLPTQSFSYAALLLFAGAVASDVEKVISTHVEEDPSLLHPTHHGRKAVGVGGQRQRRKRDASCVWV